MLRSNWVDDFFKDVRFAWRLLRLSPAFTGIIVLTLALGIGANTAIFSVMNAVVLRSLPVRDPQQVVFLRTTDQPKNSSNTGDWGSSFSIGVYEQLRADRSVLSDTIAYVPVALPKAAVRYGHEPEEVAADMVSGNFFTGLGVQPVCGRTLTDDDEKKHTQVAVLSYAYWTRRFGQTCAVIGQPLYVQGIPFTIVGVAASRFAGVESSENGGTTELWIPLQNRPDLNAWNNQDGYTIGKTFYGETNWWCLMLMGRLKPGISERAAAARLNPLFQRAAYAPIGKPQRGEKMPNLYFANAKGIPGAREDYQTPLRVLLAMVGLILVIACGNVAMMLSARNAARQREFSVRLAIGGSRMRLFRQLLAESVLLVTGGTVLGWLFAVAATRALSVWSTLNQNLSPDRRVLLFTLGVTALAALLFGLAPLGGAVNTPIGLALRTSSATSHQDSGRVRGRKFVVALQVCLCLTLLIAAGLLLRTLQNLQNVNLGMRTSGLLVFGVSPQQHSDSETIRFYESLSNRIRGLPGVLSVTLMENRLGSGWSNNTTPYVDGRKPQDKAAHMRWNAVGPNYFSTLETPILYGRDLTEADSAKAPKAVVINQIFADRYLKGQNPLGHQIGFSDDKKAPQWTVVGVAADSKYTGVQEKPTAMAYFPYKQIGEINGIGIMHVEVRTVGNPASFLPTIERTVREFAPGLPLLEPRTQQAQFDSSFSTERLIARLAIFFGLLAALLVATGLYGTLSYAVARRTAEVGVRMALGAQRGQVLWMVLKESLTVSAIGIAAGLPLALACSRLLRSILYGVGPGDPLTAIFGLLGLIAVVLLASFIPAIRAASVDPMVALHYE
jgi:predicted permease